MRALALALALLGGWQAYAQLGGIDDFILPAPTEIAAALWDDRGLIGDALAITAGEILLGIAAALVLGLLLAVALHLSPRLLRPAAEPLLVASQVIPIPVIAPLLVAWLGFGLAPKLIVIGLVCFFPIAVTTLDALRRVDPELRKLAVTLGATRWHAFRLIEAPAALPAMLSGAKVSVAIAGIAAVLAEQSAGSEGGIGHLIVQSLPQLETARAWAAVVVLSAFSIALVAALEAARRTLAPWAQPQPDPRGAA